MSVEGWFVGILLAARSEDVPLDGDPTWRDDISNEARLGSSCCLVIVDTGNFKDAPLSNFTVVPAKPRPTVVEDGP